VFLVSLQQYTTPPFYHGSKDSKHSDEIGRIRIPQKRCRRFELLLDILFDIS
jgi:hypothetical protein